MPTCGRGNWRHSRLRWTRRCCSIRRRASGSGDESRLEQTTRSCPLYREAGEGTRTMRFLDLDFLGGFPMSLIVNDLPATIRATKRELKAQLPEVKKVFAEVEEHMRRVLDDSTAARGRGQPVVPSVDFKTVRDGQVSDAVKQEIRRRGAAVIRGVFSRERAAAWNEGIGEYLTRNRYHEQPVDPSLDKYFSKLKSGRPQIFGIYWSKPQMDARQHPALAEARAFLNHLWRHEREGAAHFDPERECTYTARIRRREPGDKTLGLSPH